MVALLKNGKKNKTERSDSQIAAVLSGKRCFFFENFSMCTTHFFPMLRRFCVFKTPDFYLHSDAGRRVLATLHGAPWHRHLELVVAGRQRPITHQPAHQSVFEQAKSSSSRGLRARQT